MKGDADNFPHRWRRITPIYWPLWWFLGKISVKTPDDSRNVPHLFMREVYGKT
jgi:hypothetical protein